MLKTSFNFRLLLVCALAASVSLPIGFLSLAKFLLFIGTLCILLRTVKRDASSTASPNNKSMTTILIFTIFGLFAVSTAWTSGSPLEAANCCEKIR